MQTIERQEDHRADNGDEHSRWSAATLQTIVEEELAGADVIMVSRQEPYIHNRSGNGIALQTPDDGLVAALDCIMQACGGAWIAHGGGTADRETVDHHDRLPVPPGRPRYTLRRVWVSDDEMDSCPDGFANEGLWPLCHIAFMRPVFRLGDWRAYQMINQRFAHAVVGEAVSRRPIVLIQDYHFALLPCMVRERLPEATIITSWHIPWPNAETFAVCPWKEELISGLLGSSVLGFHTRLHCNNFLDAADRFMESRIDRDDSSVTIGGSQTFVRTYPASIEWPPAALASLKPVGECRFAVRSRLELEDDVRLAVGVEHFDHARGVVDRLRAIDLFLTQRPQWRGKFAYLQAGAPTRGKLETPNFAREEAARLCEEINARHKGYGPPPINISACNHEPIEVFELLRAANICIVASLHDGMNLAAKEFVAARDDEKGVLILSSFASASRELSEALIINPYDRHGVSAAIERALNMTGQEQQERMRLMREHVRFRNVYQWAGRMLLDANRLRRKQRIQRIAIREKAKIKHHAGTPAPVATQISRP